ncbi:hypothetical protein [Mycobacterium dioxanotrophicus]|uniref:hypothetical protein n=1 Tax=Mycobacterium dioxanotrophicus TaxID=482462 RepID=UPI0012FA8909|nr:hypothetical protein [Mycobacterium dioxanotrophicus]
MPVRAANGRIQGWAINRGNRELNFYRVTAWPNAHARAMIRAQQLALGGTK